MISWRSGFRLPVQDERDGRDRAFVRGEIDRKSLAIGRHGVLLLVEVIHGTAGNANQDARRLQRTRSPIGTPSRSGRIVGPDAADCAGNRFWLLEEPLDPPRNV